MLSKKGFEFDAEAIAVQERKKEDDRKLHEWKMRRDGFLPPLEEGGEENNTKKQIKKEKKKEAVSTEEYINEMTEEDKKILAKLKENAKKDTNSFYSKPRDHQEELLHYLKLKRDGLIPDLNEKPQKVKTEL